MTHKTKLISNFLFIIASFFFLACGNERLSSGDKFEVVDLPDNSTIFMNKGCEISYPKDFNNKRVVKLNGEAFFDVVKGDHPFVIEAGPGIITIKGTRLNVKTSNDDLEVEVEEGEIELIANGDTETVSRGERITFNNKTISKSKATRDFRKWLAQLERDLQKLGKKVGKDLEKESKKAEKKIKKIFN